ncbi:MAG: enoyl-CoA hydratase-related protein [Phycisphaerales bacterium JB058]
MSLVKYEVTDGIATITLNRPERQNALNPEMIVRLAEAWTEVRDDNEVRVAVVTGSGGSFSSGADLATLFPLVSGAREPEDDWDRAVLDDRRRANRAVLRDFDPGKPVIAAASGHAIAGGMELLQSTDIRLAVPEAKLGVQEVKWAIFPAGGSTVRMPRQMSFSKAMEYLLTGDLMTAQQALDYGFLNHVVEAPELMAKAYEIARKIAANGPLAVKAVRASARACLGLPEAEALKLENKYARPIFATEDAREGPRAFREKREPNFRGR